MWFNSALTMAHFPPNGDYGGIFNDWYPPFSSAAVTYIERSDGSGSGAVSMGNPRVLMDGSYFRSAALLDAVSRAMPLVDWEQVHSKDNRIGVRWDTVIGDL